MMGSALCQILLTAPILAAPIQVHLLVEDSESRSTVADLVASPVIGELDKDPPEPISLETEVPGIIELGLERGLTWRLTVRADGLWAPETLILGRSDLQEVSVRLVPTSILIARVETLAGQAEPARLGVRFRSPDQTPAAPGAIDETADCPVEKDQWRCEIPSGTLDLRLRAAGFISHYLWEQKLPPKETVDLGVVKLAPGASISGWLLTDDSSPLRDTTKVIATPQVTQPGTPRAEARHQSLATEARVTDRGFFQLAGLRPGAYVLHAEEKGFVPLRSVAVVVFEASETELQEPLVLTRPAELRVSVDPPVDFRGEPWSLMLVTPTSTEPTSSGRSGPDGTWTAPALKPDRYLLMITDSSGSRVASEEIAVEGTVMDHWVILEFIEVEGLVTLGGEPIEAQIAFGGSSGMTSVRMEADDEGRFHGSLPRPGTWRVDVRSESAGVFRRLRAVEVEPLAGSSRARVDFELPGTRLEGEVVDIDGRGIARATVLAVPVPREPGDPAEFPSHVLTDLDGLFLFDGFEPATYRLQAIRVDSGKKRVSEPVEVSLSEYDPPRLVRLVLAPPVPFRGRVLSGSAGVPGATVFARPIGGGSGISLPSARTSPDGGFELNLPQGSSQAELTILAPGFLFYRQVLAVPETGESPILLEQQGGGTLVIRPVVPFDLSSGRGLPAGIWAEGVAIDLGTLSHWSALNQGPPVGEMIEVPKMPSGTTYRVCWPLSLAKRNDGHDPDCDEGYLPAYGRLEIAQRPSGREVEVVSEGKDKPVTD